MKRFVQRLLARLWRLATGRAAAPPLSPAPPAWRCHQVVGRPPTAQHSIYDTLRP
jgi:hypothetical protein